MEPPTHILSIYALSIFECTLLLYMIFAVHLSMRRRSRYCEAAPRYLISHLRVVPLLAQRHNFSAVPIVSIGHFAPPNILLQRALLLVL